MAAKDLKKIGSLSALRMLTAVIGVLYSVLQVRYFGATREIEIYFAAQSLIYLITSLSQTGQLGQVFLPEYHSQEEVGGKKQADGAFSVVVNTIAIYTLGLSTLMFFLAPLVVSIIVPGFEDVDQIEVVNIFKFFCFFFVLQISNSFIYTYLNARSIYGRGEIIKIPKIIISVLFLVFLSEKLGIMALVWSFAIGIVFEFLALIIICKKATTHYQLILKQEGFDKKAFFGNIRSTFLYVISTQFYSVILTASISYLPEGIYAITEYIKKLFNVLKTIAIQPIITVFNTNVSKVIHGKSKDNIKSTIQENLELLLLVIFLFGVTVFELRYEIIGFLWEGKQFSNSDVEIAANFFLFYSVTILLSGIVGILRGIILGNKIARALFYANSLSQIVFAGLTYLLIKFFSISGLKWVILLNPGFLALAGIIVMVLNKRKIKGLHFRVNYLKIIACAIILTVTLEALHLGFNYLNILETKWILLMKGLMLGLLGLIVYLLSILALNLGPAKFLKSIPSNVSKRFNR